MKQWFVYIVKCSDNTLYTGISTDVEKRIKTHNSGKGAKYTKTRRPVKLVWISSEQTKSSASKLEYEIKQMSRQEKIDLYDHGSIV